MEYWGVILTLVILYPEMQNLNFWWGDYVEIYVKHLKYLWHKGNNLWILIIWIAVTIVIPILQYVDEPINSYMHVVAVQSPCRTQLFMTPWTAACQASLSLTISQCLPKFMSSELMMQSNHAFFDQKEEFTDKLQSKETCY